MSVPSWPSELPRPLRDGYDLRSDDPRLRRPADTGPPGYRRRFSAAALQSRMTIDVSRRELHLFDLFWRDTCLFGSQPFTMPDPATDGWPLLTDDGQMILAGDGRPILLAATWLCLFGSETPVRSAVANQFKVAFSVSVMP
ncbi:hypothetical protein ACXN5S_12580 [Pseudoroseicyclus sp. H15]